jgi:hypothetical protein
MSRSRFACMGMVLFSCIVCTVLSLQADDITPPARTVKLIFIHHSTGGNWLADPNTDQPSGGLGRALRDNNYYVSATNYGWGLESIGDRTDIPNWPEWFTGPRRNDFMLQLYRESNQNVGDFGAWSRLAVNPGGENEVIMFKSCFPNSDMYGEAADQAYAEPNDWELSVANAKAVYAKILTYFAARQDKLFIVITAPPLASADYSSGDQTPAKRAANARAFNNWLVKDWLKSYVYRNVAVFDYYNVLTSNGGNVNRNDAGAETGNHHRWWNGAVQHVQAVNNNFSSYPSGDSHPSSAGHQKATQEFVPLLNVFYHRWKTPTAVTEQNAPVRDATLIQAYPNPFNSSVLISFRMPVGTADRITIYNVCGEQILQMLLSARGTDFTFRWDGMDQHGRCVPAGLYLYRLEGGGQFHMGKMVLQR